MSGLLEVVMFAIRQYYVICVSILLHSLKLQYEESQKVISNEREI